MPVIINKGRQQFAQGQDKSMPAGNMFDPNLPIFQDPLLHQLIASLGPQNADQVAILAAAWRAPELRQAAQAALDAGHGIEGVRAFVVQSTIDRINSGNGPQLAQGVAQFLQAAGQQPQPWMGQAISQAYGGGVAPDPSGPGPGGPATVTPGPDKAGRADIVDDGPMARGGGEPEVPDPRGGPKPVGGVRPQRPATTLPGQDGGKRWVGQQPPPGINAPAGAIGYKYRNGQHLFMMPGGSNGSSFASRWVPYVAPTTGTPAMEDEAPAPVPSRQGAESYSAVSGYGNRPGSPPFNPNGPANDLPRPTGPGPRPMGPGGRPPRPTRPHDGGGGMNETPPFDPGGGGVKPKFDSPAFPRNEDPAKKRPKPIITL